MSSKRLPGKVLMSLGNRTVLDWVVGSVKQSKELDSVIIATSSEESDDPIELYAFERKIELFRGPLDNVVERFYKAAIEKDIRIIVRICGDSPLIDHRIIDELLNIYLSSKCDLATNTFPRTFPVGQSVEIFSRDLLKELLNRDLNSKYLEHVTSWVYESGKYKIKNLEFKPNIANMKMSLDTKSDYEKIVLYVNNKMNNKQNFHLKRHHLDNLLDIF